MKKKAGKQLSIIIPVYGRLNFVIDAIRSVIGQSEYNERQIEIIIVEDKTTPETVRHKLKDLFPQIKIHLNEDKEGPGGKRNTGLKHARGKYIAFLDSDDQWAPEFLATSIEALETPEVGATMSLVNLNFYGVYPTKEKLKVLAINYFRQLSILCNYLLNNRVLKKDYFWVCQLSHSVFKRSAIDKKRFDYHYRRGGEDWDMYVHVLQNHQIQIIPRRLVKFRYEMGSSTNQKINQQNKWKSYTKLNANLPDNFKKGTGFKLFSLYLRALQPK